MQKSYVRAQQAIVPITALAIEAYFCLLHMKLKAVLEMAVCPLARDV